MKPLLLLAAALLFVVAPLFPATSVPAVTVSVQGHGTPLILIPGLGCSPAVWNGTVAHYVATHEIHTVQIAGFAGAPPVEAPVLTAVRDALIAYIRSSHLQKPILVGHSLGATVAFWIAATEPDLVGGVIAIDGVPYTPALEDAAATAISIEPKAEAMRKMFASLTKEQFALQNRMSLGMMIGSSEDADRIAKESAQSDVATVAEVIYEMFTTDLRPVVGKITVPVTLIASGAEAGSEEARAKVVRDYEAEIATVPVHKTVLAPHAKHFVMLDDPALVFAEIDAQLAAGGHGATAKEVR